MTVLVVAQTQSYAQAQTQSTINSNTSVQMALLVQRADQIDRHLDSVDGRIESERQRIDGVENEISQIRGFGIGLGALLSLFQVIQVVLQLRVRKNGNGS